MVPQVNADTAPRETANRDVEMHPPKAVSASAGNLIVVELAERVLWERTWSGWHRGLQGMVGRNLA